MVWWLRFLRFWHVIDLDSALQTDNWPEVSYTRQKIADIDAEIDRRRLLK